MFRAVIFDFDGVITDSEVLHFRTFNQVLSGHNIEITKEDYYKDYLGLSDRDLFLLFIDKGQLAIGKDQVDDLIKQKNKIFEKLANSDGKIIDGVQDFLALLSQNNISIAIYSGALLSEIELILEKANLRHFFEAIVSAEHVKRGKPYPEGFLLALERLNQQSSDAILPDECIVIEDAYWGLEAAKAAKMHTVAITNSYAANQLSIAEKTIDHLTHLTITDLEKLCS